MALHTVLVPGLGCSARLYQSVLPGLWSYGAVTIADNRRDDTTRAMAHRLLSDAPRQFALLGVSMGGYVALEVIRQAPERVLALALISTSARPDTPEQTASRHRQIEVTRDGGFDHLIDAVFPMLVDETNQGDRKLAGFWRDIADEVGPDAFVTQLQAAISRTDTRPMLPTISCPTAVIHGRGDQLIATDNAEELATRIPAATLTMIDRAGHLVVQEQPAAVLAALRGLFERAIDARAGTSGHA
jgi:pimeloyl-ACP methyl ester carboxylesterase